MKRFLLATLLFSTAATVLLQAAADPPRVSRTTLIGTEENLDNRFRQLYSDNPYALPGPTRGVYLEGFGVVFTAEVNLVNGPAIHMFHPNATPEEIAAHHAAKLKRVSGFRTALQAALVNVAATLESVPDEEQIVLVGMLAKYPWEDLTGMPRQILVQGPKKKLVDAKKSGKTDFSDIIKVVEN
ncbi:MAG: hypothetical protein ABL967_11970 [Bryobacteraceae bacterium]